jgi:preprotein translocase subunit SecY
LLKGHNMSKKIPEGMPQNAASQAAYKELLTRLGFVFFVILVYRIGVHIPIPGVDIKVIAQIFENNQETLLSMFNMFSGGALERMSIFALGVIPYITASIIFQVALIPFSPKLQALKKEGEPGMRKINQNIRYVTLLLAVVQSYALAVSLQAENATLTTGFLTWIFPTVVTVTTGTMFLMWLGEQCTDKGIGNGISILITVGILAGLPPALGQTFTMMGEGQLHFGGLLVVLAASVGVVGFVVLMEIGSTFLLPVDSP